MIAYVRKMALNSYILNVVLSPSGSLFSLQQQCCKQSQSGCYTRRTYSMYPSEIVVLPKNYVNLLVQVSDVFKQLAMVVDFESAEQAQTKSTHCSSF
jgi:hypothetical protein